ncbi:hypothetical protein ACTFIR_003013 [Dictyostelium discoideum]
MDKKKEPHPKPEDIPEIFINDQNNEGLNNLKSKNNSIALLFIILILVTISFFIYQLYSNDNKNVSIEINDNKKFNEENSITKFSEKKNSKSSEVNNIESLQNEKREIKKLIQKQQQQQQQQQQSKQKINQQKQKQKHQKSYKNLAIEGNVFINGYATNHGHKEDNIYIEINVNDCQFQGDDKKQRNPENTEINFNINI